MSLDDRKALLMDLVRRLPLTDQRRAQLGVDRDQPFDHVRQKLAGACPQVVSDLLYYVGSNPRALAYGLSYLSGRRHLDVPEMYIPQSAGKPQLLGLGANASMA
jgi:hypothetical protein